MLALALMALDLTALAKPEVLESVVRRAPTWEQLVAFRQRRRYFSTTHATKQRAARLAASLRTRAAGGGVSSSAADAARAEEETARYWIDGTLEPTHQAAPIITPIERDLPAEESPATPAA